MPKGTRPASLNPLHRPARTCFAVEALEGRRLLSAAIVLDVNNRLLGFDTDAPATITRSTPITGLASGESILAVDYRPATGGLYGLGSGSRLYAINTITGAAEQVGSDFVIPLEGDSFDLDFNPAADLIRVVSNADQNLRVNPNTGAVVDFDMGTTGVQPDGEIAFAAGDDNDGNDPVVIAAAYDTNVFAATAPTLYALDSAIDALVTIGSEGSSPVSPNSGQTFTVGDLGVDIGKRSSLDIRTIGTTNTALAVLEVIGQDSPQLYSINLDTGVATLAGAVGASRIVDFAIAPPPAIGLALTTKNDLFAFDANNPTTILRNTKIRGLAAGENILGIDFRPSNGLVYAISSQDRIHTINPKTGRTVEVGDPSALALDGRLFGFDFNPAADAIRLVSNKDQNLRFNATTGAVVDTDMSTNGIQGDGDLAYDAGDANAGDDPLVTGSAYTGNDNDAATPTELYGIDTELNALVRQGSPDSTPISPNAGTLFTVGSLGFNAITRVGFDITTANGTDSAFATLQVDGQEDAGVYRINLTTGAATRMGTIGGNRSILGLAMAT